MKVVVDLSFVSLVTKRKKIVNSEHFVLLSSHETNDGCIPYQMCHFAGIVPAGSLSHLNETVTGTVHLCFYCRHRSKCLLSKNVNKETRGPPFVLVTFVLLVSVPQCVFSEGFFHRRIMLYFLSICEDR